MVCCSRSSILFEGASRRAFFYSRQSRLFFILLAVVLHAALLLALSASTSQSPYHRQALSVHIESHRPVQMVSIASVFSPKSTPALIPVKIKRKTFVTESDLPKAIADAPSETLHNALTAAPPQVVQAPAGPVVGLALPQFGVTQGHRRLWSFQPGTTIPDEQALRQAQMQREEQLAIQAGRIAIREKFEAELMIVLSGVQLNSSCQVIIPSANDVRIHCENDLDTNAVRAALNQAGDTSIVQVDATSLIIDLTPRQSGGVQAVSHRSNSESLQN